MKKIIRVTGILFLIILTPIIQANNFMSPANYFTENEISLGFNNHDYNFIDIPKPPSPLFWQATTKAQNGAMLMYQHLLWHSKRFFSLNWGTSASGWFANNDSIFALSLFLELRFWLLKNSWINPYLLYSVAGPSLLSKRDFANTDLGKIFIFQDMLGFGFSFGQFKAINLEIKAVHYSNGDIFTVNHGFDVPLVFSLGYAF